MSHGSTNFLGISRNFRNRLFWDFVKDFQHERRQEGLIHAGKGPRCEWEDVLCIAFGVSWRDQRDSCRNYLDWKKLFPLFVTAVCREWSLPTLGGDKAAEVTASRTVERPLQYKIEDLPDNHGTECPSTPWWRGAGCFTCVVDCKPLAQVTNGQAPLKAPDLTPMFERMTRTIFDLIQKGWSPHSREADPVLWHRREHNRKADHIVNATMDKKEDWQRSFRFEFPVSSSNLLCHSDGGTRGDKCSAAGWIIEAVFVQEGKPHIVPVAMGGKFFAQPLSSFLAEAIALEETLNLVSKLIQP